MEWMEYYNVEPFGEYRSELRHGQSMAMTANINRDSKNRPEPFAAVDFMNFVEREPEKVLTQEELEEAADRLFGG